MNLNIEKSVKQLNELAEKDKIKTSIILPLTNILVSEQKLLSGLISTANKLRGMDQKRLNLSLGSFDKWRKKGASSVAIYHCGDETITIPLPFHMEPRVIVASSFHVKPIFAAYNSYTEAILIHFHDWGATLFRVTEKSTDRIDSVLPSSKQSDEIWHYDMKKESIQDFISFIQQELIVYAGQQTSLIAITGSGNHIIQNRGVWKSLGIPILFLEESWRSIYPERSINIIKRLITQQIERNYKNYVGDLISKNHINNKQDNFDRLLNNILCKRVSDLIVSLDDLQFGALDIKSGKTILYKKQQDCADDDVLDDILEIAFQNGVKVKVIPRTYMPPGITFIAA